MKIILGILISITSVCIADDKKPYKENTAIHKHQIVIELMEREISLRVRCDEIAAEGVKRWDQQQKESQAQEILRMLKTREVNPHGTLFCGQDTINALQKASQSASQSEKALAAVTRELGKALSAAETYQFADKKITPYIPSLGIDSKTSGKLEAEWKTLLAAVKNYRSM